MQPRDMIILEHIHDYCEDIEEVLVRLENSDARFSSDTMAQYAIAFSILQIGELVSKLSEELRLNTKAEVDWSAIKGMRNIIAHDYGEIRLSVVWNVAANDIPSLKAFCERLLDE